MWSEWTVWSNCAGQCTGGYSTRHQTRTRTRVCNINDPQGQLCHGDTSQNETRPCSSVELHGCLNPQNAKDNSDPYAYGVAYNFRDELAQSTCAGLLTTPSHVAAIRRNCYSGQAAQCSTICHNNGYACVDELHVYIPGTVLNPNKTEDTHVGLSMYRYFSCTFGDGHCGPNYCCCTWP
ncbi:uncharacterized protein LOC128241819 [Mya arenaria]|uniref:uncharacterized protein LOC128241819 n=1 Tax=Mya arenaria TaxID=6604 RepID=UPI0022E05A72|nr:uncharacterized protein LOC128241819 [Mya arenaria]